MNALPVLVGVIGLVSSSVAETPYYFGPPKARQAVTNRQFTGIPSVCATPGGRLWATWYAGPTPAEDLNNYIVLATSADGGKTWKEVLVTDPDEDGPSRCFDANLWITPDGRLQWNWSERLPGYGGPWGSDGDRVYVRYGDDPESETMKWTERRVVGEGVAMGKSLRLSTGEWAMPVCKWFGEPSSRMFVSTDGGASWTFRGGVTYPRNPRQFDEHQFVENADGTLQCFSRTYLGIGHALSKDRGRTWTPGELTWIPQPCSRFFVRRLRSGRLLLVKHGPVEMDLDWSYCGRERLMAFLSEDDGATWKGALMLDERKTVSYPDGDQLPDGSVVVIYDRERTEAREILLARFTEEDVLAGKPVNKVTALKALVSKGSFAEKPAGTNECCVLTQEATPGSGFTFDFRAASDRRFPEDTASSNLVTKIGPQDSYNPIVLPDAKGGTYRLQYRYRSKVEIGKRKSPNAIVWDAKRPGSWDVFRLQPAGDAWNYFSTSFKVAEGVGRIRLQFRGDGGSRVEAKDVRVFKEKPHAGEFPVELRCEPCDSVDSTFAVSQNQPGMPNFVWRRPDGDRTLNGKYDFVLTLSHDFAFVDSLFAKDGKVVRETREDGTTVARWRADANPEKGFNDWHRFGLMVTTSAPVDTKGTLTLAAEADGRRVSNEVKLELFVVPEIRAKVPKDYRNGFIIASGKPFVSGFNDEVNRLQAAFMGACGVRFLILSAPPKVVEMWRKAGIDVVLAGSPLANGYSFHGGAALPPEDRFVPLKRLVDDPHWFRNAYCPVSIYEESAFFKTNMVPHLGRHLKGFDGMWANWEPYGYAGKGCFCDRCEAAFVKWSGAPESVVATNWPDAYATGGACRKQAIRFRAWQHGQVMKTLNKYITRLADGGKGLGFVPGIECGLMASNWEETQLFAETAVHEYVGDFLWTDPWGPYSGVWDARKTFVDSPGFRMGDFFGAVDIARNRDAKWPSHKILAFPNGYQCGGWTVQPETLEMNMDAYFFAGWDATTPYFFPCGYDARYYRALANATTRAAECEDVVRGGTRIDGLVSVTPDESFPAPLDYATPILDASGGNLPGWSKPASLLQTLAWERNGRRIVAVFNFHTEPAEFLLRFSDTGFARRFTVPACRTTVLAFRHW